MNNPNRPNRLVVYHTPQRIVSVCRDGLQNFMFNVVVQEKGGNDPYTFLQTDNKENALYRAKKVAGTIRELGNKKAVITRWQTCGYDYKSGCHEYKAAGMIDLMTGERLQGRLPLESLETAYSWVELR
jgi:hypothetical protein